MSHPRIKITMDDGTHKSVELIAEFSRLINGHRFALAVTRAPDDLTRNVTHVASGHKVCAVAVTDEYLVAYSEAVDDVGRANVALDELIAKYGAGRVSSVMLGATP